MKAKRIKYPENLFESFTDEKLMLPNPWQTIYYEGIRGNHLLFTKEDQQSFRAAKEVVKMPAEPLGDFVISLANYRNVSDLRLAINRMPYKKRAVLYSLYERAIRQWRDFVKSRLH